MNLQRKQLLAVFQAALDAVNGCSAVKNWLTANSLEELNAQKNIVLIAIGKAAPAMAQGALEVLGDNISTGLVISKYHHFESMQFPESIRCMEAAHPRPDQNSLDAGTALLEQIKSLASDDVLLMLISGGASALVEVLPEGVGLEELDKINHWLLAGGMDIIHINQVRKQISCIKGGRLRNYFNGQQVLSLLISDVPGDDLSTIGSGLLAEPTSAVSNMAELPDWLREIQGKAEQPDDEAVTEHLDLQQVIIANNVLACRTAAAKARELGYAVYYHEQQPLQDDATHTAEQIVTYLKTAPNGLHIWGGETTMVLPPKPGRGGRNQHLALVAAQAMRDNPSLLLLAAGTDGTDGPTEDAGALVDGGTVARGEADGLDVMQALQQADAGTFLEASGDLVYTGPTGTNVMDMVIAVKSAD